MANKDASFGLKPVGLDGSSGVTPVLTKYIIKAAEGTDIFVGDPVINNGTAILDLVDGVTYQTVSKTTAGNGNESIGVVVAFIADTESSPTFKTDAVTQRSVLVADDPEQIFEIQADGSVAVTDFGNTADLIYTNAGSTATGLSGAELDTSDIGTGKQLVIVGMGGVNLTGRNDIDSANPVLLVKISEHQKRNLTGV